MIFDAALVVAGIYSAAHGAAQGAAKRYRPEPEPPVYCVSCGAPDEPLRLTCSYCLTPGRPTPLRLSLQGLGPSGALDVLRAQQMQLRVERAYALAQMGLLP